MHANTVRVCVCVCVCVELHISVSKGSAGGCTSEVSPCLSLFSPLPSSDESLFYTKTPFSRETAASQRALIIPRFLCFFYLSLIRSPLFSTHRIRDVLAGEDVTIWKSSIVSRKELVL